MPTTRPADYYLGYDGGSVFMDFNDTSQGICLIRISFDGYGCCSFEGSSIPLNSDESNHFREIMQESRLDQDRLRALVKKAIALNIASIWEEALEEYELI